MARGRAQLRNGPLPTDAPPPWRREIRLPRLPIRCSCVLFKSPWFSAAAGSRSRTLYKKRLDAHPCIGNRADHSLLCRSRFAEKSTGNAKSGDERSPVKELQRKDKNTNAYEIVFAPSCFSSANINVSVLDRLKIYIRIFVKKNKISSNLPILVHNDFQNLYYRSNLAAKGFAEILLILLYLFSSAAL